MERYYQAELEEVRKFLETNKRSKERYARYKTFQKKVVVDLKAVQRNPVLRGAIVSVNSREDFDPQNPLKTIEKIAIKLHKWRNKERESEDEEVQVKDIHDIIGVTVCCPYPSDVRRLVDYLEKQNSSLNFVLHKEPSRIDPISNFGYEATHIVLKGKGSMRTLLCELQIKTVMIHGWGVKTHDITYKPTGFVDKRLGRHLELLSRSVQLIDDQSDIVNDLIKEEWALDKRRRRAAQIQMMGELTNRDKKLIRLKTTWEENREKLMTNDESDQAVNDFEEAIEDLAGRKKNLTKDLCRIVAVYAIGRHHDDKVEFALSIIDEWIDTLKSEMNDYRDAVAFRSCVAMALGEFEECIDNARVVVTLAEQIPLETSSGDEWNKRLNGARLNLAYFLAEAAYHHHFDAPQGRGLLNTQKTEECRQEALEIIRDYQAKEVDLGIFKDTVGAVLIFCGHTEKDVREGLQLCNEAIIECREQSSKYVAASECFFELHERRAFRRILALG
ncbi:MAG: RelA/SpoT domain-containing protein [Verrucomicrobiota bacterium]